MRQKYLGVVVAVMTLLALAACRGNERSTVTGGYGSGVITGEVVMTESGSPAGVEISVRGSGQSAVLAADGRFAFGGLPEAVDLELRRADGINASLRLDEASGHVVIELAQTTARKSSGRRRSIRGGGTVKVQQFEGVIREAAAEEIVVYTSHKEEVTIGLDATTVIRKGNTTLTPADLLVDWRVHVKAQKNAENKWVALLVIVQNTGEDDGEGEDDAPAVREYEGTVVSASETELVIFDSHKTEVTFVINGETEIRKGNTAVPAADIQEGWRVHVKATSGDDGTKTAVRVTIQNTKTR